MTVVDRWSLSRVAYVWYGYVLVEAAEPGIVQSFVSKFIYWNDVKVVPVIDIAETVGTAAESLAWARAASSG